MDIDKLAAGVVAGILKQMTKDLEDGIKPAQHTLGIGFPTEYVLLAIIGVFMLFWIPF